MDTLYVRGVGELPAKRALDVRVGDKLIYEHYQSGVVKAVNYRDDMVDMTIEDTISHSETRLCKFKAHLVAYVPNG